MPHPFPCEACACPPVVGRSARQAAHSGSKIFEDREQDLTIQTIVVVFSNKLHSDCIIVDRAPVSCRMSGSHANGVRVRCIAAVIGQYCAAAKPLDAEIDESPHLRVHVSGRCEDRMDR